MYVIQENKPLENRTNKNKTYKENQRLILHL